MPVISPPADKLPLAAEISIATQYDPKASDVASQIQKIPNASKPVTLSPNFEDNAKALEEGKAPDWQENIGRETIKVFEEFADTLTELKFDSDEMP